MKRGFIYLLVALLIAVGLSQAIEYDPGYLLLSYGHYTLETTIWVAVLLVFLLIVTVVIVLRILSLLLKRSYTFGHWFSDRRSRQSQQKTAEGIIALVEGNWSKSKRLLAAGAERSETPLINYLFAAYACNELGEDEQSRLFLQQAEQSTRGAEAAMHIAQAEMQLKQGNLEDSLAILNRVRDKASQYPYVLRLLKSVYIGLADWQGLAGLLADLKKNQLIEKSEWHKLSVACAKEIILAMADKKLSQEKNLSQLHDYWHGLSKMLQKNSEIVAVYVQSLITLGEELEAEKILRQQLNAEWSTELIGYYGKVKAENSNKQLLVAEHWLQERNSDAALLLCLGRLSLRNELWGKAKSYFESSYKLVKSAEVCAELGRLLACLGDHEKSNDYFHQGLLLSSQPLPELPLPKPKS